MNDPYVNIHTHRPTGRGIELRAEGIHPWQAEATAPGNLPALTAAAQAVGEDRKSTRLNSSHRT